MLVTDDHDRGAFELEESVDREVPIEGPARDDDAICMTKIRGLCVGACGNDLVGA